MAIIPSAHHSRSPFASLVAVLAALLFLLPLAPLSSAAVAVSDSESVPAAAAVFPFVMLASLKRGVADEPSGFAFIDGFSLPTSPSDAPTVVFNLSVLDPSYNSTSPPSARLSWAVYVDEVDSWPRVLSNRRQWSCQQLLEAAETSSAFEGWDPKTRRSHSPVVPVIENSPHLWFLALVRCGDSDEVWPIVGLEYEVQLSLAPANSTQPQQLAQRTRRGGGL